MANFPDRHKFRSIQSRDTHKLISIIRQLIPKKTTSKASKSLDTFKSFFPFFKWLPTYGKEHIVGDVTAGLTVALTVIPQSLAYANLAGLPVQYGLYSSFMGVFIYCFLGTSKDVTLGPTAIMSLIVRYA
jgi:sodium-independent sulfate anion transporter 11